MAFDPTLLLATLAACAAPAGRRWLVAYSGGADSHALLHALVSVREGLPTETLHAVHVDHQLSPAASDWARHCAAVCAELQVPFHGLRVDARPAPGESPEAAARAARYRAMARVMQEGDCLITAHHQDDQAETLLLQLLRGGGPRGLAGMSACALFSPGTLCRPLLGVSRDELRAYAAAHGLHWIEDHSNLDIGFDRNYLRHEIIPRLRTRWPAVAATLSRSARHNAEAARLLDELARADLEGTRGAVAGTLSVTALRAMTAERLRNLVRYWLREQGLPVPGSRHLEQILTQLSHAAPDSCPCVAWSGAEVHCYRDLLYAMAPQIRPTPGRVYHWDMQSPLVLEGGGGVLSARSQPGTGLSEARCRARPVTVRFRHGGERCRPAGRGHTHAVKKLFQERGVPPWERDRIPFVYIGEQLAEVAGLWICEPFQAQPGEAGICVEWQEQPLASD